LPSRHGVFDRWTPGLTTVVGMSPRLGSDPLADAVARVLVVPVREMYAMLVSLGFVEIVD
jgi:hypothetical protein